MLIHVLGALTAGVLLLLALLYTTAFILGASEYYKLYFKDKP